MKIQKRKPFSTLAKELKQIRSKPLTKAQVEKANSVLDEQQAPSAQPLRRRAKIKDAEL